MAWNDVASNQMVSYFDASTSGIPLLSGQSHFTTLPAANQCMDKTAMQAKYSLNASNLSTYGSLQLVPKSAWASGINPGFGSGFGPAGAVLYSIEVLPDDKLVIGGIFSSYQGVPFGNIVRLNPDGSIDTSFVTGIGFPGYVKTTTTLPDGTMYVGGIFTAYNGTPANGIIKLLANGSIDTSFNYGTGFNIGGVDVSVIAAQPDGKIIVGGGFTIYNGSSSIRIIRLNSTGTIDTTFLVGSGFNNTVQSILVRTNGSIIVGGTFTTYKGTSANGIIGLTSTGEIYSPFVYGTGLSFASGISIKTDGSNLFVGGAFTTYQGVSSNFAIKLNQFGTKDTSFNIGTGFNSTVLVLSPQTDGNVFAAGFWTTYQGTTEGRVIRLTATGTKDTTFNAGTGFGGAAGASIYVQGMVRQSIGANAGKYVIIGQFTTYNGAPATRIIRLNVNGTKDI